MIVTRDNLEELLNLGISNRGAWNRAQLEAILPENEFTGYGTWSVQKGWKLRLIGTELTQAQIDEFLRLKNTHIRKEMPLFV